MIFMTFVSVSASSGSRTVHRLDADHRHSVNSLAGAPANGSGINHW